MAIDRLSGQLLRELKGVKDCRYKLKQMKSR